MGVSLRRFFSACLLSAAALAAAAAEAPRPALQVAPAGAVRPGRMVSVGWPPLPPATDEFELLLRYEAPLSLTVRLTESENPALASLIWRVLNLPPGSARLVLRAGGRRAEVEWAQSEPFRIEPDDAAPVQGVALRRGELWLRQGPAPPQTAVGSGHSRIGAAPGGLPAPPDGPTGAASLPAPGRSDTLRPARPAIRRPAGRPTPPRAPQRRVLRV